jgi:hypothetical protein
MTDTLTRYWTALGFTTAVWAALESALDLHVQLNRRHYGGSTIQNEIPRGLKPTITFLKRAFSGLKDCAPYKEKMIELLTAVEDLSNRRHLFIHGAATSFLDAQKIPMSRLRGSKTTYTHTIETTSIAEIYAVGTAATELVREISALGLVLRQPFPGDVFDDPES